MQVIHAEAIERVLAMVDAVVVVGRRTNESERLLEKCRERRVRAFQVECAREILPLWFGGCERVGVTAVPLTPAETVAEVERRLAAVAPERWRRAM